MIKELYQKAQKTLQNLTVVATILASAACAQTEPQGYFPSAPSERPRVRPQGDIPSQQPRVTMNGFIMPEPSLEDYYETVKQLPVGTAKLVSEADRKAKTYQYGLSRDSTKKDISDALKDDSERWNYAGMPKRNKLGDVPARTHYSGMPPDDKPNPDSTDPHKETGVFTEVAAALALAAYAYFLSKGKKKKTTARNDTEKPIGIRVIEALDSLKTPQIAGPGAQHQDAPVYQPRARYVQCKPKC